MTNGKAMKKIIPIALAAFLALPLGARAESSAEMFANTNWNLIAAGVYDNYIFYKTSLDAPNIDYFRAAMKECVNELNTSLQAGELDWQDAAMTNFKNLVAIAQVGLYEMNRYVAEENITDEALQLADILRSAYASMREKGLFSASEADFMRDFRKLEESGIVARTCANETVIANYKNASSTLQFEYVKTNNNVQHALFSARAGNQSCEWTGDCIRMEGGKIACRGSQGAAGTFEAAIDENGRLTILSQTVDGQCGFAALGPSYARADF